MNDKASWRVYGAVHQISCSSDDPLKIFSSGNIIRSCEYGAWDTSSIWFQNWLTEVRFQGHKSLFGFPQLWTFTPHILLHSFQYSDDTVDGLTRCDDDFNKSGKRLSGVMPVDGLFELWSSSKVSRPPLTCLNQSVLYLFKASSPSWISVVVLFNLQQNLMQILCCSVSAKHYCQQTVCTQLYLSLNIQVSGTSGWHLL